MSNVVSQVYTHINTETTDVSIYAAIDIDKRAGLFING